MNRLLFLWDNNHSYFLVTLQSVSLTHTLPSVVSVLLHPAQYFSTSPVYVSSSNCKDCCSCVTISNAVFYSMSTVCHYFAVYALRFLCHCVHSRLLKSVRSLSVTHIVPSVVSCHYIHCCLLQSVHCLSISHNVPSVFSVLFCPLLSSTTYPKSVSTSHRTVWWSCVTMSNATIYSLSKVCQSLTPKSLMFLGHYAHWCLLHSVKWLSVPHNVGRLVLLH
jgi:hypothetical protein